MGSNVEEYRKYRIKQKLLGVEDFKYKVNYRNDRVDIEECVVNGKEVKLCIQPFVTGIFGEAFRCVEIDKLKVECQSEKVETLSRVFKGFRGKELNLSGFRTNNIKYMDRLFEYCSMLEKLDISSFNTSNVEDMEDMFSGCKNLKEVDLSSFDTRKVKNMNGMFGMCSSLIKVDLGNFNTSNVEDMSWMFENCEKLKYLDLSSFNTDRLKCMDYMFDGCSLLNELDIRNFNVNNIGVQHNIFICCNNLKKIITNKESEEVVKNWISILSRCSIEKV